MTTPRPPLILASASPRRRELLGQICSEFRVEPSEIDETIEGAPTPEAVAALALAKARAVAARVGEGLVLAADTVVVIDGEGLGKPESEAEARAMLRRLRGRWHDVITGVAAVDARTGRQASTAVVSRVLMREYGDAEVDAYVGTGEPLDKAGAYAIQGAGSRLVAGHEGSFSNIVGLPLDTTARLLRSFGVPVRDAPAASPSRAEGGGAAGTAAERG